MVRTIPVFTKKQKNLKYHIATFNEPLTQEATTKLPTHLIEEPDLEGLQHDLSYREQFGDLKEYQRTQIAMQMKGKTDLGRSRRNDL